MFGPIKLTQSRWNKWGRKKMHLIFPHYFQSFYSATNDFCPQKLQISLMVRKSGSVDLKGLNTHIHTGTSLLCASVHTYIDIYEAEKALIDNLRNTQ